MPRDFGNEDLNHEHEMLLWREETQRLVVVTDRVGEALDNSNYAKIEMLLATTDNVRQPHSEENPRQIAWMRDHIAQKNIAKAFAKALNFDESGLATKCFTILFNNLEAKNRNEFLTQMNFLTIRQAFEEAKNDKLPIYFLKNFPKESRNVLARFAIKTYQNSTFGERKFFFELVKSLPFKFSSTDLAKIHPNLATYNLLTLCRDVSAQKPQLLIRLEQIQNSVDGNPYLNDTQKIFCKKALVSYVTDNLQGFKEMKNFAMSLRGGRAQNYEGERNLTELDSTIHLEISKAFVPSFEEYMNLREEKREGIFAVANRILRENGMTFETISLSKEARGLKIAAEDREREREERARAALLRQKKLGYAKREAETGAGASSPANFEMQEQEDVGAMEAGLGMEASAATRKEMENRQMEEQPVRNISRQWLSENLANPNLRSSRN